MASEAITRNDLTNILNEVLPPTSSEYRKLLWTNPNPTSAFVAQTISLDLSDYDEVEIEAKQLASGSIIQLCRVGIGKQTKCLFRDGTANNFYGRTFITSTSSVQFGDAYYNATLTNTDCVPTTIYGIKYERVAPPQAEVADCIVEQGTSGSWTYRKWNSGIYECWVRTGNGSSVTIYFPITFVEQPRILATSGSSQPASIYGSVNVFTRGTSTSKTDIHFEANVPNTNLWADVYVIGKWK